MKKTIFLAVLGLAAGVASSSGQGYVIFSSYLANGGNGAITTFVDNIANLYISSHPLTSPYTAQLWYAFGTVSDPVDNNLGLSICRQPSAAFTFLPGGAPYEPYGPLTAGYFDGGIVTIPGYVSGPITFEMVAYNGADWLSSTSHGRSGSFTMDSIANSGAMPAPILGDNGQPMPDFHVAFPEFVAPTPEPTTLALAGLGSLVALVAFRRKS